MATLIGSTALNKLKGYLTAPAGLNANLAALTEPGAAIAAAIQIVSQNAPPELADRAGAVQYPAVSVYCEKLVNDQREKFLSFSGTVALAIEVRHSQDQLDGIGDALEQYVDAVTQTLTASRGDWGGGMYFAGNYQVSYGPVKRGGKNFLQTAKVTFEVGASVS